MTKCQHCDADILSTSQPNRMGTTPEMQKMYDEFGGDPIAWRVTAGKNTERHLFENKRDAQLMRDELEENGWLDVLLIPLFAALAATPAVGGECLIADNEVKSPAPWPDPTPAMLDGDPLFDAIWNVIKRWDINVPHVYGGYMGATGNHVRAIYDAAQPVSPLRAGAEPSIEILEDALGQIAEWCDAHGKMPLERITEFLDRIAASPLRDLDIPITIDYYAPLTLREIIVAYFMADNQQYEGLGKRHADRYLAALSASPPEQPASPLRGRELATNDLTEIVKLAGDDRVSAEALGIRLRALYNRIADDVLSAADPEETT